MNSIRSSKRKIPLKAIFLNLLSVGAAYGLLVWVFIGGNGGWIGVELAAVDDSELRALIRQAWRLIAPKRLADTLANDAEQG